MKRKRKYRKYIGPPNGYQKWYSAEHREKKRRYHKKWWKLNGAQKTAKQAETRREHSYRHKIKALQIASGQSTPSCKNCGCTDIRILNINHVNGGGSHESRCGSTRGKLYRDICKGNRITDDLDVRCCNCNILFEYESKRRRLPLRWQDIYEEVTTK